MFRYEARYNIPAESDVHFAVEAVFVPTPDVAVDLFCLVRHCFPEVGGEGKEITLLDLGVRDGRRPLDFWLQIDARLFFVRAVRLEAVVGSEGEVLAVLTFHRAGYGLNSGC